MVHGPQKPSTTRVDVERGISCTRGEGVNCQKIKKYNDSFLREQNACKQAFSRAKLFISSHTTDNAVLPHKKTRVLLEKTKPETTMPSLFSCVIIFPSSFFWTLALCLELNGSFVLPLGSLGIHVW